MFKWFIIHQWKSARRSSIWQKNVAINILVGFLMLIMLLYLVLLGAFMDEILLDVVPDRDPENVLSGILLYYFIITFVLRYFLQTIPAIQAIPYLHLPVKRNTIARYLVLKSLSSFFNWMPFFIFLPFALLWIPEFHSSVGAIAWFASVLLFEWTSNFKMIWFKRRAIHKPQLSLLLIVVFALLFVLDYFQIFSVSAISEWFFMGVIAHPIWVLFPLFTMLLIYFINLNYIKNVVYLEDLQPAKNSSEQLSGHLNRLQSYGVIGELVLKEVRLLFRNKRPRTVLFMIPFFLLYGLFFYPQEVTQDSSMLVFVGIFVTGGFLIAYGQYIMAWESTHFDSILTSNVSYYDFFRAKYYLMVIPTVILFILTIPYLYFGVEILWMHVAALFYNIGVNAPLLLYTASYNKKRMDISKGAMMNYQGVGVNNFIMVLPLLLVPVMLFWPVKLFFGSMEAILFVGSIGFIALLFNKWLIALAVKHFTGKRYEISKGYRQKY